MEEIINFTINGQILSSNKKEFFFVENSVGYIKAKFTFSSDWKDVYKIAVFEYNNKSYYVSVDDEDLDEDKSIKIPYKVIKTPGFSVSCFGSSTKIGIDLNGQLLEPQVRKRITTDVITIALRTSGPLTGITPPAMGEDLNTFEMAELALRISKEAYTTMWNMQYSLREINELLGGDPYALCKVESKIQEILKTVNGTQIKKDEYGIPQFDNEGNYIFEEVAEE